MGRKLLGTTAPSRGNSYFRLISTIMRVNFAAKGTVNGGS